MTTYSDTEMWMALEAKNLSDFVDVYFGENPAKVPIKDRIVRAIRLWQQRGSLRRRVEHAKERYENCKNGNTKAKASASKILIKKK